MCDTCPPGVRKTISAEWSLRFIPIGLILSYLTLVKCKGWRFVIESPCDYMILNSVANLKRALQYLERYTHIHCFLDNGDAGRKTVETIMGLFEYRVMDESFRYAEYKDVNDYLMGRRI